MLNMTQHPASSEQIATGVVDLPASAQSALAGLLTVEEIPSAEEITQRCEKIAALAEGHERAMIGGAPWMMSALESALKSKGIAPCYAFSRRESAEAVQPDGSVRKVAVFRHLGFVYR